MRFEAYCSPVRSRMSAPLAVNFRSFSISARVSVSLGGFPRASAIFARRLASGTYTGVLRSTAVAVNATDCEICAAVTLTVVVPTVSPSFRRAVALPVASVVRSAAVNLPVPAVMLNVTGTPENGFPRWSTTSTTKRSGNGELTMPCSIASDIFTSLLGTRSSNVISIPLACMTGICVWMDA